ncbi:hypothetical protein ZIOFF_005388 [Zingiber officinale]|uniref:Uncharacterized protein n=1 Tax=Zingiber officinale TaxID=94328 RepID=A0A8J5ICD9_ZINOF|nr:hypothetical protein ZIOFF_005388 [Zingiber officinale]
MSLSQNPTLRRLLLTALFAASLLTTLFTAFFAASLLTVLFAASLLTTLFAASFLAALFVASTFGLAPSSSRPLLSAIFTTSSSSPRLSAIFVASFSPTPPPRQGKRSRRKSSDLVEIFPDHGQGWGHFDDVERAPILSSKPPKETKEMDENKSKKGLAEIYEEEYAQKTDLAPALLSAFDKLKIELLSFSHTLFLLCLQATMLFKKISLKLDALSHFHFAPKPVIEDMSIQVNVPALAMEEVALLAVSDAAMLAPEEIFHGKGNIKEEAELTKEERKRRRANQKRRFRRLKVGGFLLSVLLLCPSSPLPVPLSSLQQSGDLVVRDYSWKGVFSGGFSRFPAAALAIGIRQQRYWGLTSLTYLFLTLLGPVGGFLLSVLLLCPSSPLPVPLSSLQQSGDLVVRDYSWKGVFSGGFSRFPAAALAIGIRQQCYWGLTSLTYLVVN